MNNPNNFIKTPDFIKTLFNSISADYDKLNDLMSFGLHRLIKKDIVNQIKLPAKSSQQTILDLCTGTGDIAKLLKKRFPKGDIIGVDFSEKMLDIAKKKHPNIKFIQADCSKLPFKDNSIDACTISFGLRNVENIELVVKEIFRVLKKDGIFINLDLGKPNKLCNFFLKPYMFKFIPFLGKLFHKNKTPYEYLAVSNDTFLSPEELRNLYQNIGFKNVKIKKYLFGQISSQTSQKD